MASVSTPLFRSMALMAAVSRVRVVPGSKTASGAASPEDGGQGRRIRLRAEIGQGGVIRRQHFIRAELERGLNQPLQPGTDENGRRRPERFGRAQRLPRGWHGFALKMVNVYAQFHSTFSARIFSTSVSVIASGLSPVMISQRASRAGGFIATRGG